ncbi:MAG: alginate export family protein [Candidatus Eisenbacteria bacterium]
MKKLGIFTMALLFLAGSAGLAVAGSVNSGDDESSAQTITISGSIELTGYVRTEEINEILDGAGWAFTGGVGPVADSSDFAAGDAGWTAQVKVRFDIGLAEKVSAVIELGNRDLGGNGHVANASFFGSAPAAQFVTFLKGYIRVDEFLYQQLSFQLGWQDFHLSLRGDGNSFLVDLTESELAFMSSMQENYAGRVYGYGQNTAPPFLFSREKDNHVGGFRLTYNDQDQLYVDFFAFNIREDDAVTAGTDHEDELFYGINVDYNLDTAGDRRSLVNAIFAMFSNDQNANRVYSIGAGIDYWWEQLELFGEIHGQFGDYAALNSAETSVFGTAILNGKRIDQKAYGGYVGGRYEFESEWKPYLELSFWYLTGDDGQRDDDNEDFVSYENVNDAMIIEGSLLGLDVDSNYWALKLKGGITTSLDKPEDFDVAVFYGHFQTTEDVDRAGTFTNDVAHSNIDQNLGDEIDLAATWRYSESLTFELKAGFLFNGDFWGNKPATGFVGGYASGDDSMQLYTFTTDLKF